MKTQRIAILRKIWKPLVAVIGLVLLVVWTTGVLNERVPPDVLAHTPGFALPPDAETVTVHLEKRPTRVEVVGTVISDNTVSLSARINAYVAEILVSAGEAVQRDQPLIRLDDRDVRAQRDAALATVHRTQTEYERFKTLHASQAATEQQLIAAESAYQHAKAQLEQVEVALSYAEIRSPMDGMVSDRHAEVGTLANPGQTLVRVYDPAVMRLDAPVPVRLVDFLEIGDVVDVHLERPDTLVQGRVHRIVAEIDPRTRTQTAQILLLLDGAPILPGTFGRVQIPTDERDVYLAPDTSIYRAGQLEMVYVVEEGRAVRRMVRTGSHFDGQLEILSGLKSGDVLWVNATHR